MSLYTMPSCLRISGVGTIPRVPPRRLLQDVQCRGPSVAWRGHGPSLGRGGTANSGTGAELAKPTSVVHADPATAEICYVYDGLL